MCECVAAFKNQGTMFETERRKNIHFLQADVRGVCLSVPVRIHNRKCFNNYGTSLMGPGTHSGEATPVCETASFVSKGTSLNQI